MLQMRGIAGFLGGILRILQNLQNLRFPGARARIPQVPGTPDPMLQMLGVAGFLGGILPILQTWQYLRFPRSLGTQISSSRDPRSHAPDALGLPQVTRGPNT
jgi:hypothetical protein